LNSFTTSGWQGSLSVSCSLQLARSNKLGAMVPSRGHFRAWGRGQQNIAHGALASISQKQILVGASIAM